MERGRPQLTLVPVVSFSIDNPGGGCNNPGGSTIWFFAKMRGKDEQFYPLHAWLRVLESKTVFGGLQPPSENYRVNNLSLSYFIRSCLNVVTI